MVAGLEDSHPRYLSASNSDVIVSDIRPMKLMPEVLHAVNVFLDELLWNILNSSRSLSTDRMKACFLKILPTTLGKEALLEAELELKAYWERTKPSSRSTPVEEGDDFPVQWSFELLRLKCEAYSTLNDSDENINSENRLSERMRDAGFSIVPPVALVNPAAFYLTAIVEHICGHILSNISRVVARDSSRTIATPHDLFVALCEDATIYSTFKSMKVYDHIENLQKVARLRRSKSFSRDKLATTSRTSSHSELTSSASLRESSLVPSRFRMSSDSITSGATAVPSPSRASLDRARSKIFGTKNPSDNVPDPQHAHRRTESGYSDSVNDSLLDIEDQSLMDEFDELMRSGATMKVSLTPDRLKSMEVYNKGKNKRSIRRPTKHSDSYEEPPVPPIDPKRTQRAPALRHVASIIEDEEDSHGHPATKNSAQQSPSKRSTDQQLRSRSVSTSQLSYTSPNLPRKSSWSSGSNSHPMPNPKHPDASGKPSRTRKIQQSIENVDLDDVSNVSDEEEQSLPPSSYRGPMRSKINSPDSVKVSANTRDLMDFLDKGPPEDLRSATAPPQHTNGKSKSGGRLGRIMSKLTGGASSEKLRENSVTRKSSNSLPGTLRVAGYSQQSPYTQSSLSSVKSMSIPGVIVATPPRPPRPSAVVASPSPPQSPLSPAEDDFSFDGPVSFPPENSSTFVTFPTPLTPSTPVPIISPVPPIKHVSPRKVAQSDLVKTNSAKLFPPARLSSLINTVNRSKESLTSTSSAGPVSPDERMNGTAIKREEKSEERPISALSTEWAQNLRRLLAPATTADECRVLVDMFLARKGLPVNRVGDENPYSSPSPDPGDAELENSLVEVLLGDGTRCSPSESTQGGISESQKNEDTVLLVAAPSPSQQSNQSVEDTQFPLQYTPQQVAVA